MEEPKKCNAFYNGEPPSKYRIRKMKKVWKEYGPNSGFPIMRRVIGPEWVRGKHLKPMHFYVSGILIEPDGNVHLEISCEGIVVGSRLSRFKWKPFS